jgi:hypothetical protein
VPVKGGRTAAGRAYQKHMDRGELPVVPGTQLDDAGQALLDGIVRNSASRKERITSGNFKGGARYVRPDGRGATYDSAGQFWYFGVY